MRQDAPDQPEGDQACDPENGAFHDVGTGLRPAGAVSWSLAPSRRRLRRAVLRCRHLMSICRAVVEQHNLRRELHLAQREQLAGQRGLRAMNRRKARDGCEQAAGTSPLNRLVAAMDAKLGIDVSRVSGDGVYRKAELTGDFPRCEPGWQVAQDPDLAVGQGIVWVLRPTGPRGGPGLNVQQIEDLGDQSSRGGAAGTLPLQQPGRVVQEKRQKHAVGQQHSGNWLYFRNKRALGQVKPGLCLLNLSLPNLRETYRHIGNASDGLVAPAVPPTRLGCRGALLQSCPESPVNIPADPVGAESLAWLEDWGHGCAHASHGPGQGLGSHLSYDGSLDGNSPTGLSTRTRSRSRVAADKRQRGRGHLRPTVVDDH